MRFRSFPMLSRTVMSWIAFKLSSWPHQNSFAAESDALQIRIIGILLREPKLLDEMWEQWLRRRNKVASANCFEVGRWLFIWAKAAAKRCIAWHDHIHKGVSCLPKSFL